MQRSNYHTISLSDTSPQISQDLTYLHQQLFPRSPITKLGKDFIKNYYYNCLPHDGLLFGQIAYIDDCPAGFVTATHDSDAFMRNGLRRNWRKVIAILSRSALRHPILLSSILETYRLMRTREADCHPDMCAEILSLGVLPEFRTPDFIRKRQIRLADDLYVFIINQILASHTKRVRAIIDHDNSAAQLFYYMRGWKCERSNLRGWRVPSHEFILRRNNDSY